jgi:hypothetical protein
MSLTTLWGGGRGEGGNKEISQIKSKLLRLGQQVFPILVYKKFLIWRDAAAPFCTYGYLCILERKQIAYKDLVYNWNIKKFDS